MRPPKSRHSDARNSHIASLVLEMPVLVSCSMCATGASASASSTLSWAVTVSANGLDLLVGLGVASEVSVIVLDRAGAGVGRVAARAVVVVGAVDGVGVVGRLERPAVDAGAR